MSKKFLLLLLFFYSNIFAKNYCINVDEFYLNTQNEKKIQSVLEDVAYPSWKIKENKVYIFSGNFSNYDNAKNILKLINTKYTNAKVTSCDGTQEYKNGMKLVDMAKSKTSEPLATSYCLKVLDIPLTEKAKRKNKINYMLTHFPDTKTKTQNNRFSIYSGKFTSLHNAQTVVDAIKDEFPETIALKCNENTNLTQKSFYRKVPSKSIIKEVSEVTIITDANAVKPTIIYPKRTIKNKEAVSARTSQNNNSYLLSKDSTSTRQEAVDQQNESITIFHLDNKGYLSQDIKSYNSRPIINTEKLLDTNIATYDEDVTNSYLNGLYLKLNTAYDTRNNNMAYDTRLEYDLFKEGYFEQKKRKGKQQNDNKLKVFQILKSIYSLNKDKELAKIQKYTNSIGVSNLLLNLNFVENFLNDAREKLALGYITKYEYREYQLVLRKIQNTLYVYNHKTLLKIPANIWFMLNKIERVELVDFEQLSTMLTQSSLDMKEASTLHKKDLFTSEWADRLKVNLYAGERKLYASQKQTLFGVDAKIPLYDNSLQENKLQKIENSLRTQKANYTFMKEKDLLHVITERIKDGQNKIRFSQEEMADIKRYVDELNVILESGFSSYTKVNYTTKQKAIRKYLNIYSSVQKERIVIYEDIINLLYLVHARSLEEILYFRN